MTHNKRRKGGGRKGNEKSEISGAGKRKVEERSQERGRGKTNE